MCILVLRKLIRPLFYLAVTFLSFSFESSAESLQVEESASDQEINEPVIQVAVSPELPLAQVHYQEVEQERVLDALVEAVHKATVSAQTSGRVSKIYYDVNDYAKKGAVLLRMRDKEQQAQLKVAQADFNQAQSEFKRVDELYAKQLVSRSLVDKAEADLKSSSARFEQAQENLERTVVRAPYSGILVKRHIEVGETARSGTALFTGLSLESLRVVVNLPQDIINAVMLNKAARVLLLDGQGKGLSATNMTISPYADAESHTFLVRVNLPAGDHGLYPGMAVKVAFVIGQQRKLLVPRSAVAQRSEVAVVYVMDEHKQLSMRQVRIGQLHRDSMIEVLAGLQENEQVSIDPIQAVSYLKEQGYH